MRPDVELPTRHARLGCQAAVVVYAAGGQIDRYEVSQTAPPNRDTKTGDPKPDTDATPESPSRDWKETVAAVTSTVTDAAIEAVTVVGDAARSLTARARGGERSESDGWSGAGGATASGSDDTAGANRGTQLLDGVRKKLRPGPTGAGTALRNLSPRARRAKPATRPAVRTNGAAV